MIAFREPTRNRETKVLSRPTWDLWLLVSCATAKRRYRYKQTENYLLINFTTVVDVMKTRDKETTPRTKIYSPWPWLYNYSIEYEYEL